MRCAVISSAAGTKTHRPAYYQTAPDRQLTLFICSAKETCFFPAR